MSSNIPQLRFAEFSGEWTPSTLKEISGKPMYGLNTPSVDYDGENGYIRITDIDDKSRRFIKENITSPLEFNDDYLLNNNDILFTRTGASVGKSYKYSEKDGKLYFAGFLIKFPIIKASTSFVFFQTQRSSYDKWVLRMSMRSGQPGINAEEYSGFSFLLPDIDEQQKIGSFLSAVDSKIEGLEQELGLLKRYKQGIMQRLFNQTLRFKDNHGNPFPAWQETKLGDILKLNQRPVAKPQEPYWRLGIRSHAKGVFKEYVKDYDKIMMDELFVVRANDFILNITFAWEHAIAIISKEDDGLLVSHRFPTYEIDKTINPMFLQQLTYRKEFKSLLSKISPGGAGRNKVLNKTDFLKQVVMVPCPDEQEKITDFLSGLDTKIESTQKQIDAARNWKKSLLQKMFV